MFTRLRVIIVALIIGVCSVSAQVPAPAPASAPAPAPAGPVRLELTEGSVARYRVREQLAGISFPNDAIGTTSAVSGTLVLTASGAINPAQSKITVDLRTLKSDQDQRDGFVRGDRLLNVEKFPQIEFLPRRVVGLPWPLPSGRGAQAGFQIVGDMTVRGVTREVTWNTVATFTDTVAGLATTQFRFDTFGLPKPQLARLLSVADDISLELEFRFKRVAM